MYVMWMGAGEPNGTFGLSAVATSRHPDGPFSLRRTLYPDGNETHDQTVFMGESRAQLVVLVSKHGSASPRSGPNVCGPTTPVDRVKWRGIGSALFRFFSIRNCASWGTRG